MYMRECNCVNVIFHREENRPTCRPTAGFEAQAKLARKLGATLSFNDRLKEHYYSCVAYSSHIWNVHYVTFPRV